MGTGNDFFATMGLVNAGVGAGAQASAGYSQSVAARAQGNYQDAISSVNASQDLLQAKDALHRGEEDASRQALRTRQLEGSQEAAAAANGVQVGTGSAGMLVNDSKALGELDVQTIRHNAYLEAMGYRMKAAGETAAGRFARLSGRGVARSEMSEGLLGASRTATYGAYQYGKLKVPKKDQKEES